MAAKTKSVQKLETALHEGGLRKNVAQRLAGAAEKARGGKQAPKAVRGMVADLRKLTTDLEKRLTGSDGSGNASAKASAKRNGKAATAKPTASKATASKSTKAKTGTAKSAARKSAAPKARTRRTKAGSGTS